MRVQEDLHEPRRAREDSSKERLGVCKSWPVAVKSSAHCSAGRRNRGGCLRRAQQCHNDRVSITYAQRRRMAATLETKLTERNRSEQRREAEEGVLLAQFDVILDDPLVG